MVKKHWLKLGWAVTETLEPRYWIHEENAQVGKQKPKHL